MHPYPLPEILYEIFRASKLYLPLELWIFIVELNLNSIDKCVKALRRILKFPRSTASSTYFYEFQLLPAVSRFDYGFIHSWDVLYDSYGDLIHKVHAYGMVINIGGTHFPRSRACLYADYGTGCTWIFEHESDVTTLTYDLEYGYRSLIAW
jgi:hypothetical protein